MYKFFWKIDINNLAVMNTEMLFYIHEFLENIKLQKAIVDNQSTTCWNAAMQI